MDVTLMLFHSFTKRIEVKGLQGSRRSEFQSMMSDEQLDIDKKDIRFNATEPMLQSVEQRPRVVIVVVGVSLRQWHLGWLPVRDWREQAIYQGHACRNR